MQRADSLEKTLMLGKMEGRRWRGWQDEMAGWHHGLNGHELEQTPRNSEGQGSLVCCSLWSCRVRHYLATQQQQEMVITANPATIWTIWRGTLQPTTWLQFKSFSTHHFFYRTIIPTSSYLCTYGSFFLEFIFFPFFRKQLYCIRLHFLNASQA